MKITRKQLRQIIKDELSTSLAEGKKKRKKGEPKDQYLYGTDVANSEDEVARQDAWAGGDNLNSQTDWQKVLDMIKEEALLVEKNENPSWHLYKYTGDVWKNLKTSVQGAAGESSKVANAIRDIYVSLGGIALQFAAANTPGGKISRQDVDRNINEINTRLNDLRKFSQASPAEIAVLTGDEAFNVSKMKFATRAEDIEVDGPQGVAIAADKPKPRTLKKYYADRNAVLPSKKDRQALAASLGLPKNVVSAIGQAWANDRLLAALLDAERKL